MEMDYSCMAQTVVSASTFSKKSVCIQWEWPGHWSWTLSRASCHEMKGASARARLVSCIMTTSVHPHVGKILPQGCIHLANWPAVCRVITPQQPMCIAKGASILSCIPGTVVAARSPILYGRLSTSRSPLNFPFRDHNLQGSLTASLKKACHSALQDLIQEPSAPSMKDETAKSDHVQNEEAEGNFKAPMMRLRSLLHLQDTNTSVQELLAITDYLERLGLDIYFREEIKCVLDHAFRIWTQSNSATTTLAAYGLGDLKNCALAFYLLRSHEYEVSPSIFRFYQKDDGNFGQRAGDETSPAPDVLDLLNLLRASDLRFRRDAILHEAFTFSSAALQRLLDEAKDSQSLLSEKANAEITYRLKFPWATNFRVMETRQTITNLQAENVAGFSRLSSTVISLMLALATQIINKYLPVLREEVNSLEKWTEECGLAKYNVRPPMMLLPFGLGYAYNLPPLSKYSHIRVFHAKVYYCLIVTDDLIEAGANIEDLQVFLEALKRWDPSLLEKIPPDQGPLPIRVYFKAIYDITNDALQQSSFWHGRDLLPSFIDAWLATFNIYFKERLWEETFYQPTLDEYVNDYAKISFATQTGATLSYYSLPWELVDPEFLRSRLDMRIIHPIAAGGRFLNDVHSYELERAQPGKEGNVQARLIDILVRENPMLTEKDAMEKAKTWAELARQEAIEELLCSKIPYRGVKDILLAHLRITYHIYSFVDGLRDSNHALSHVIDQLPHFEYEELPLICDSKS